MSRCDCAWLLLVVVLSLSLSTSYSNSFSGVKNGIKSAVFLSPKFELGPGDVGDKYYLNIDFPRGHIALKGFDAEVIDEDGNSVPLHETYLHHWAVVRYYGRKGIESVQSDNGLHRSDLIYVRNSGLCQGDILRQYFGLGSETRRTSNRVPDPYGIEIGNPAEIPEGYEEIWLLNVHSIDTRGVEDKLGCTECYCDLYNVTVDAFGRSLRPGYKGGLDCCYDQTHCRVRRGFGGGRRGLYLRYNVTWVDMDSSVLPVKIYMLDVADTWRKSKGSTGISSEHDCKVEYDVEQCSNDVAAGGELCIDNKRTTLVMPFGGYFIYGAAHQHSRGTGSALYREDGEVICKSMPIYGRGHEPGNEAGYIVGMSTCYPKPGSVRITESETIVLESNYSSTRSHTGVMGLFYIMVSDYLPKPDDSRHHALVQMHDSVKSSLPLLIALLGVAAIVIAGLCFHHRSKEQNGYQQLQHIKLILP